MKRFSTVLSMIMIAFMALSFTSCDKDSDEAYDLSGRWKGNIESSYYDYRYGKNTTRNYTIFEFYQNSDFARGGYGYEVDYAYTNYDDYSEIRFNWEVNNGRIYINYDDGKRVVITDYRLGNGYFSGYMDNAVNGDEIANFNLQKTDEWHWSDWRAKNAPANNESAKKAVADSTSTKK